VPPSRLQPRVRFPAPYSPAGSTRRDAVPEARTARPDISERSKYSSPSALEPARPATSTRPGASPSLRDPRAPSRTPTIGKPASSGKSLDYVRGPTRRLQPRESTARVAGPRTDVAKPPRVGETDAARPPRAGGTDAAKTPRVGGSTGKDKKLPARTADELRRDRGELGKLRQTDPVRAKEVAARSTALGRVHDAAIGTAVGSVGGVYRSAYRGGGGVFGSPYRGSGSSPYYGGSWCDYPWGFSCDDGFSFYVGFSFGYYNSCYWSWWPCYVGWYYPYYCWSYYPSYYYGNCYAVPAYYTTVVYADESEPVYVESVAAAEEPVGESVARYEQAPAQAPSALSIVAQRYLDLGDRAFREGRYTDAVQFYAKAVEFAPDEGALYLVLADALFAAGDYHYGAYAIRRALELDPALVDPQIDKHGFYPEPGVFDRQLATLEAFVAEHPADRDARLVLALNYLFGARAGDAVRTLEVASSGLDQDQAALAILTAARAREQ
jgi:hypothetical protein